MEVADDAKDLLTKIGVETSLRWVLAWVSRVCEGAWNQRATPAAAAIVMLRALVASGHASVCSFCCFSHQNNTCTHTL